jgi:lysophospholipase L1-like esterase
MRRLLFLLALLLPLALFARPAQAAEHSPVELGDLYLALGDSLATGFETAGNADGQPGYPVFLHQTLLAADLTLDYANLGMDGESAASMLLPGGQLERAEALIAQERTQGRRIALVTLSIGGNDIFQQLLLTSDPDATERAFVRLRANLEAILGRLRAALGADTPLLVMSYYNPYPGLVLPGDEAPRADLLVPRLNTLIAELAAAHGAGLVDVYTPFLGREAELTFVRIPYRPLFEDLFTNYDFHPRLAGHLLIAERFALAQGLPVAQAHVALLARN